MELLPWVTGSLAGFEWLSGYHPTAEEAKILLEKTAIPNAHSHDNPRKNGVGIVNAYKLGMVGKKLKEACGTDIYCFKNMIRKDSSYDFPEDQGLFEEMSRVFPECSSDNCKAEFSVCIDQAKVFKRLRKAVLLNPSNKELWKHLACVYNSSGFTKNGEGIMNIYKSLYGPTNNNKEAHTLCREDADCTLIPSTTCGGFMTIRRSEHNYCYKVGRTYRCSIPVLAKTVAESDIHYAEQHCSPKPPCNEKCRCENQETIQHHMTKTSLFSSRCVNSQCVLNTDTIADTSEESSSGTGQR